MLRFFHALTSQHALALLVHLEHVKLRLLFGPPKNLSKDMRDVIHEVDRVVPANNQVTGFQVRFRLVLGCFNRSGPYFRSHSFDHGRKLKDEAAVVESVIKVMVKLHAKVNEAEAKTKNPGSNNNTRSCA